MIFHPVMLKYEGKQIFSFGSIPEVGEKQKTKKEKESMCQLRFRPPPQVKHASRLDQFI